MRTAKRMYPSAQAANLFTAARYMGETFKQDTLVPGILILYIAPIHLKLQCEKI